MSRPTDEQRKGWAAWLAERPEHVRKVAERFSPWKLYVLRDQVVGILSFEEDDDGKVTVTVGIDADDNPDSLSLMMFGNRNVFGVDPDKLTLHGYRKGYGP